MTDRELLEMAAKAAGYTIRLHSGACKGGSYDGCSRLYSDGEWRAWRPREDDGDAFRLACAVKLNTMHGIFSAGVGDEDGVDDAAVVMEDSQRCKVLRGLIFAAAVEMGKAMP